MKKIFVVLLFIVLLVLGASVFVKVIPKNNVSNASQESVELSGDGVTLLVPGNWVSAESMSNNSVIAVADPDAKDSEGFNTVNVNVEKKSSTSSLEYAFNNNYNTLARNSDYEILYCGNVTVGNDEAMEAGYTSNVSGILKHHKSIWFKKDSSIYVILCTAPESQFESKVGTFDFIINNAKFN